MTRTPWYARKFWRFAYTNPDDKRTGKVRDVHGRWVRIAGGWWWRLGRRRFRRLLAGWALKDCPHTLMKADVLEGGGDHAVMWCPDCGKLRIVPHDTSQSYVIERQTALVDAGEASGWE